MKRLLLFAALIAWSGIAGAVVYRWVDAQGKVLYGDRPPDGVHAEVVELLGTHVARTPSTKDSTQTSHTGTKSDSGQDDASTKKAVDSDVQQVKDQQCAAAQEQYKKLIEGRRIYKTGADGERQYLTSEEIDTQRADAKREIDATCNSST
jgi:hypothetical protein